MLRRTVDGGDVVLTEAQEFRDVSESVTEIGFQLLLVNVLHRVSPQLSFFQSESGFRKVRGCGGLRLSLPVLLKLDGYV